jgi:RHS repeat-associated protein
MCPGIAVLGGGGGGGDGDGDGSGNGDGNGGDGNGNGDGTGGDGKGGGNCGAGGAGGCTNCHENNSAGDPVDVVSGRVFTVPFHDLYLPGPIKLDLLRSYTTRARDEDVGLGWGWGHSLAWRLERRGREVHLRSGLGDVYEAPDPKEGETVFLNGGFLLTRYKGQYCLDTKDDFYHVFEPFGDEPKPRYLLTRVQHQNGNGFELGYDARGALEYILDSAGRKVHVETNREGRIVALRVEEPKSGWTITFARYEYDDRGNLVVHTDADGNVMRFWYDEDHLLTKYQYPNGLTFHFVYDEQRRCVETWGAFPDGSEPGIDPDAPKVLHDGRPAKGIYHTCFEYGEEYTEVVDSIRLLRYFADPESKQVAKAVGADGGVTTRAFDKAGNMIAHVDATGAASKYEWDFRGRLLKDVDALGRAFVIERDEKGRVIRNIDRNGGVAEMIRDERGNAHTIIDQRGARTRYTFDDRGLITSRTDPDGTTTRYRTDDHGNLVELIEPSGARWQWKWDYFGRPTERVDPRGGTHRHTYSDGGNLLRTVEPGGRVVEYTYDEMGDITSIAIDGVVATYRFSWLHWQIGATMPNGDEAKHFYNREGWGTKVVNEKGEEATFRYSAPGYVIEERGFDGAKTKVKYDKLGRRIAWETSDGKIEIERDAIGRVVAMNYPDGSVHSYEYDGLDEMTRVTFPGGEIRYVRDACGAVLKEEQILDGVAQWVEWKRDILGRPVGFETSRGHREVFQHDHAGRRVRSILDEDVVEDIFDELGRVRRRVLPGGAAIDSDYDERYRLTGRRVVKPSAPRPGEPAWVGADGAAVVQKSYQYGEYDNLIAAYDGDSGTTRYEYDRRQRLLSRIPERGEPERFTIDRAGNHSEIGKNGPEREYGRGNRLLGSRTRRYAWDDDGRLAKREDLGPGGDVRTWKYEWNAQSQLAAVDTPDGRRVEFAYDPFGRRLRKKVLRKEDGVFVPQAETRFIWAGGLMIHEITRWMRQSATMERVYAYDDSHMQPFAHREEYVRDGALTKKGWFFYVGDPTMAPEQIVTGSGEVVARATRTAYGLTTFAPGSTTSTPVRFDGQYEDVETGLCYNRYRYYDPEVGRYISPDPLGLNAGLNLFTYCRNPIGFVDPLGLKHHCSVSLETADGQEWTPDTSSKMKGDNGKMPGMVSGYKTQKKGETDKIPNALSDGEDPRTTTAKTKKTKDHLSHTEQKACEWAEKHFSKDELRGAKLKLGGQFPPCPRCHAAMQEFAAKNGAKVEYHFPPDNKITYDGTPKGKQEVPIPIGDMNKEHRLKAEGKEAEQLIDGKGKQKGYRKMFEDGENPDKLGDSPLNNHYTQTSKDQEARIKKEGKGDYKDPNAGHSL